MLRTEVKWSKKVLALYLMFVVLFSSIVASSLRDGGKPPITEVHATANGKINTTLSIKVYDAEGNLKQSRVKDDDLLLTNCIKYIGALFISQGTYAGTPQTIVLKDTSNTDRTFNVGGIATYANTVADCATGSARKGGFIGIGTGTTDPTRADYNLETAVESLTAVSASYPTWDSTSGNITVPSQITITDTRTITEAVLGVYWIDSGGTLRTIIHFRDEFAGVSVVATDVMAITYYINLKETNFLTNFAYMFGGCYENMADGGTSTLLATYLRFDTGASTVHYWYASGSNGVVGFRNPTTGPFSFAIIGTGSTAVSRGDYKLVGPVEANTPYTVVVGSSTIVLTADVPCASARTIQEAGIRCNIDHGTTPSATNCLVMLRVVFASVSVPAGGTIRIILTITV